MTSPTRNASTTPTTAAPTAPAPDTAAPDSTAPDTTDTSAPESLGWSTVDTPDGPFTALFDDAGVVYASGWTDDPDYLCALIHSSLRPRRLVERDGGAVAAAVHDYYAGDLDAPARIAVRQHSGPFLRGAWAALREVPAGPPVSYRELASRSGNGEAVRAAAMCCAKNAAALFVPCHRVIRTDGSLGGFRYGLDVKRSLLAREARA